MLVKIIAAVIKENTCLEAIMSFILRVKEMTKSTRQKGQTVYDVISIVVQ